MDTLAWSFSVLNQRVSSVVRASVFWGVAFIIVLVLLREHLLCFFDLKIYNKNVHIWDSLHYPTEFLFLLSKSVRTVYADVITKFYGIARFPVLNFYPMIAMGLRYNKKISV